MNDLYYFNETPRYRIRIRVRRSWTGRLLGWISFGDKRPSPLGWVMPWMELRREDGGPAVKAWTIDTLLERAVRKVEALPDAYPEEAP